MTPQSIAIVILAAGESARMRLPKQLLPYKGRSLIRHTIDQAVASKANEVLVVLGANAPQIQESLRQANVTITVNSHWTEGMGSSIRAGIGALSESTEGAIISLCDQPFLTTSVFDNLIDSLASSGKSIAACEYDGTVGVPVLFSRKHFSQLMKLRGENGARVIVEQDRDDAVLVSFPEGSVDIDTPEDYRKFLETKFKL
jgi:molybdenum cofactor cytidylyltransferase